jgi:pimeloyl-ACP methyl ester carboxylesterase
MARFLDFESLPKDLYIRLDCVGLLLLAVILVSCTTSLKSPTPPPNSRFHSRDGVNIHFKDVGAGRPVVFLHGFGTSLETWRFMVETLEDEYRLVLLDLKGHGLSDRPRDEMYAAQDHARVVRGLIEYLGLKNVVIVGHSFGSVVGLAAALDAQRVGSSGVIAALFLIAGSVDAENVPFVLRLLRTPILGWLSLKLTSASFRTRAMLKRAYHDDTKVTDSVVELYARYQSIPGTDYALIKSAEQLVPVDISEPKRELSRLEIPVINIWGEHDVIIPRPAAESVCRLVPRCELVTIEGVGHIPQEESPKSVIALLRDFLRRTN